MAGCRPAAFPLRQTEMVASARLELAFTYLKGRRLPQFAYDASGCRGRRRTSIFPLNRREPYQLDDSAIGRGGRTRTCDRSVQSRSLCQLSYTPLAVCTGFEPVVFTVTG